MSRRKQINCTKCGETLKELIIKLKKNKFVNLESFFAVNGNALSTAFRHSTAKDLPRQLEFFFRNHN